ncbi:hypothetical protein GCM10009765_75990 [Fodinicola feengrottensis]|uniref:Phage holin family protein n=1 Tax=Fodinicola feengrottensis TaxID=435914 RepID=A0ABN2J262_9ACTN
MPDPIPPAPGHDGRPPSDPNYPAFGSPDAHEDTRPGGFGQSPAGLDRPEGYFQAYDSEEQRATGRTVPLDRVLAQERQKQTDGEIGCLGAVIGLIATVAVLIGSYFWWLPLFVELHWPPRSPSGPAAFCAAGTAALFGFLFIWVVSFVLARIRAAARRLGELSPRK